MISSRTAVGVVRGLVVVLACVSAVGVATAPAFAHTGTLIVSKTSGLQDEEWITVSGEGFSPDEKDVNVGQCPGPDAHLDDCNVQLGMQAVTADSSGAFGPVQLRVLALFNGVDCRKSTCVIRVFAAGSTAAAVPLSFGEPTTAPPTATPAFATTPVPAATPEPPGDSTVSLRAGAPATTASATGTAGTDPQRVFWFAGIALATVLAVAGVITLARRRSTSPDAR